MKEQSGILGKDIEYELPIKQHSLCIAVRTLVLFIPLTNPIPSFKQVVNKRCMTYSDTGASKKTQYCGLLNEQSFIVHLPCARHEPMPENTNINILWPFS